MSARARSAARELATRKPTQPRKSATPRESTKSSKSAQSRKSAKSAKSTQSRKSASAPSRSASPASASQQTPASARWLAPARPRAGAWHRTPPRNGKHTPTLEIHLADNLDFLRTLAAESFDLIYIDPPFNTGRTQKRLRLKTVRDDSGDRIGFKGNRYRTTKLGTKSFADTFDDYLAFLEPRFVEAHRVLAPTGSFFVHLDFREVHYAKVLLDQIFGRASFVNEIVWAYDYGARATKRWSPKHDDILWYAKDPERYTFNLSEVDRIPYMAPTLVGEAKAARGKTPTDTWWHTIVSPTGKEKTGYPTQKPLGILERIVRVHSNPGDRLLDFFAGSGSFGEAALRNGRSVVLVDENAEAIEILDKRLQDFEVTT